MTKEIEKILFTADQISVRVNELAKEINDYYKGEEIVVVPVLKGGALFASDLVRGLDMKMHIDFIACSSYGMESITSGKLTIKYDISVDLTGKKVLIMEDIVDTGITLHTLVRKFKERGAADVKVVTMLSKPSRRMVEFEADFTGFVVPDEFVVGYGLDYADRYRNLPYIAVLSRSVYEKN